MTLSVRPQVTAVRVFTGKGTQWRAQHWVQTGIHGPFPHGMYFDVCGGTLHDTPQAAIHEARDLI
jgi:hypothetical protein